MQANSNRLTNFSTAIIGEPDKKQESVKQPSLNGFRFTNDALKYIEDKRKQIGLPVKGVRIKVIPRSPLKAEFALSFVPAEEQKPENEFIMPMQGLDVYLDSENIEYLEGATVDFVFKIIGSELKVNAPLRNIDTLDSRIAKKIEKILEEQINPSLAAHSGAAELIDVRDCIALIELIGGCQGCSMANATMKGGIERTIRENIPEVLGVRDITNHAKGSNPFFK